MSTIPPFQTTFAVPLSCESCIKDVQTSLFKLPGINKVEGDLQNQLVSIEGTASPSTIVQAIQDTGRDAILRGSGAANSAAVCILESHSPTVENKVRGLARMVQVAPNMTIIDLSLRGISPGTYYATVRERGDISEGPESTGPIWEAVKAKSEGKPATAARGVFGTVEVSQGGVGTIFLDKPIQIWEMIGRSIVVAKQQDGKLDKNDPDTLVGVIARSAGVWDNDKTVCSCSGKTVWEERKEQVDRGML
ncbi:superoxide dismutase [Phyllosticta citribraziliensis]|uniref:Superoxide dismutase 1 copper chaperone n=1 Tax=Phyllosticta citribraziliensis TaxID=989973 RepID=A0ABR1LJ59_9PEZI